MSHFTRKTIKNFKFGVNFLSFIPQFLFCILFSAFFISFKLITNRASEFSTIFIIRESTKKDVASLIKTTYKNYIYFDGGYNTKRFIQRGSDEKNNAEPGYEIYYRHLFKLFRFPEPLVKLMNSVIKDMVNGTT